MHDAQKAHFFALQVREGCFIKIDGDVRSFLSSACVVDYLEDRNFTFYQFRAAHGPSLLTTDSSGGTGQVHKKPASASAEEIKPVYTCPLTSCLCDGCSGALTNPLDVDAVLYTFEGPVPIIHRQKQCASRACRACYAYNYRWDESKKVNVTVVNFSDLQEDILFINSKKAFSLKYLQCHEELRYRGHLSSRAISDAYHTVHSDRDAHILQAFHKLHLNGIFY